MHAYHLHPIGYWTINKCFSDYGATLLTIHLNIKKTVIVAVREQNLPCFVNSRSPVHRWSGCGAQNRNSPTGGFAYGIPRNVCVGLALIDSRTSKPLADAVGVTWTILLSIFYKNKLRYWIYQQPYVINVTLKRESMMIKLWRSKSGLSILVY